jgi:peptidoglycan/LPS O-acetylase OafA/YrhL
MKKLIWTLFVLMFGYSAYCQVPDSLQRGFDNGINQIVDEIKMQYIVLYIILAWLLTAGAESDHASTKWLNFIKGYKLLIGFIIAFAIGLLFYWQYRIDTREGAWGLIISGFFGMAIYNFGIDKVIRLLLVNTKLYKFLFKTENPVELKKE